MQNASTKARKSGNDPVPAEYYLPRNTGYEGELLAELLFTRDSALFARIVGMTEPEMFFSPVHRKLFEAARKLFADGLDAPMLNRPLDVYPWGTLFAYLRENDREFFDPQGRKALAGLWDFFVPGNHAEWLVDELTALAVARERRAVMEREKEKRGAMTAEELEALWSETDAEIQRVTAEKKSRRAISQSVDELVEELRESAKLRRAGKGVTLGIPTIDREMGGIIAGELICIAARAGVGKTTLLANIAHHRAEYARKENGDTGVVVVFAMDEAATSVAQKLVMRSTGLDHLDVAYEEDGEIQLSILKGADLYRQMRIYSPPSLTVPQLVSQALMAKHAARKPLELVLIDHHGKLTASSKARNPYEVATETVRALKVGARELNCPVILLVQLSRKGGDGSARPSLDQCRDSGAIEEESDLLIGAWRPKLGRGREDDEIHLAVLKSKRMPNWEVVCNWDPVRAFIGELVRTGG